MSVDLLQPRNMHKKEHAPQTSRGGEKASAFRSKGFWLAEIFAMLGSANMLGRRADVGMVRVVGHTGKDKNRSTGDLLD